MQRRYQYAIFFGATTGEVMEQVNKLLGTKNVCDKPDVQHSMEWNSDRTQLQHWVSVTYEELVEPATC